MTQFKMTITTLLYTMPVIHGDKIGLRAHFEVWALGHVINQNEADISLEGIEAIIEEVTLWADELFSTGNCESDCHYPYLLAQIESFEI